MSSTGPLPATIGEFEVHGILGRGGMGTVYSAFDPTIQRPVAIKALIKRAVVPSIQPPEPALGNAPSAGSLL